MGICLTNWWICVLLMAQQMAIVRGLCSSARKGSHTDAIQTTNHCRHWLQTLRAETSKTLAVNRGKQRSGHPPLRSVSWAVLKSVSTRQIATELKCCPNDHLESVAWAVAVPVPLTARPWSQAWPLSSTRDCVSVFAQQRAEPVVSRGCSFREKRHQIFTATTSGQRTVLMAYSSLDTRNISALISGQVMLVNIW